ncbi:MAG: hypothetical protein NKF70_13775 [Methanobacterium sp. ERen5]|nr:MAG: hypothetical protein NKF70_13775 [Methanobacterium sp. ERen5]
MKRITISIDSELDIKFRKKASQKYQFERGWYSIAVAEAMTYWADGKDQEIANNKSEPNTPLKDHLDKDLLNKINSELNLEDDNLFENFESLINHINNDTPHKLLIEREKGNIVIKMENDNVSDLKTNLESFMFLYRSLGVILSALEETSKEKFDIVGMGEIPPVYIKK